jgi:hypothetical protein
MKGYKCRHKEFGFCSGSYGVHCEHYNYIKDWCDSPIGTCDEDFKSCKYNIYKIIQIKQVVKCSKNQGD